MLKTRVITAAVLLAVFAGAWFVSLPLFETLMAAAFMAALGEWLKMLGASKSTAIGAAAATTLAAGFATFEGLLPPADVLFGIMAVVTAAWVVLTGLLFAARNTGFRMNRMLSGVLAWVFPITTWLAFMVTMGRGLVFMLSVFAVVWLADISAYFCGRAFGKTKMAPAVSPGKTWAGAVGAVVFVFLFAAAAFEWLPRDLIFTSLVFERMGYVAGFAAVFLLVAMSIAGDLFESAQKRQAGVKDSSNLLPGHGGFYDRFDSAQAVFPAAALLMLAL